MKLIYSELAVKDLTRLRSFIAEHDALSASKVTGQLINKMQALVEFPRMGVPVANAPDPETLRDLILDNYVIRYTLYAESVAILKIWHHRENRQS